LGELPIEERLAEFFKQEKYRDLIARAVLSNRRSVPVDFGDLLVFDSEFAGSVLESPDKTLPILNAALNEQVRIEFPDQTSRRYVARVRNLPETLSIRSIRAQHLRKLVSVDGIVVRASTVRPMLVRATYRCRYCGKLYTVDRARPPARCESPRCSDKKPSFEFVEEDSEYVDFQLIGLQEKPEELPPGQLPRTIEVSLTEDLVDAVAPGDRVTVCGIVRAISDAREQSSGPLRLRIEGVSVETRGKEMESLAITPQEEKEFLRMASQPGFYETLIESIAPSIQGHTHIKEAILLALVGSRQKVFPDGVRVRGDIHLLLVGDPGTAKSTLLLYAAQIAPRGVYTTGRGSTAAGLTAAVIREQGGGMVLEAGATVLADMGVCVVDEIDKMRPEDRVAMHEVMANQTVSIAKGGIVATLNARCSILAAANPELGRYDPYRPFNENVNLPVTLLSRFDLIFVLRDEPNPEMDRRISTHMLELHMHGRAPESGALPPETLKKYIAFAKRFTPVLSREAAEELQRFYLQMRSVYERTSTVAITARQLESLVRLAEARARALLREVVTKEDAEVAIRLMKRSLSEVGIDVETGKPDIDVIMSGKPKSVREKLTLVIDTIKRLEQAHGYADDAALRQELESKGLTKAEIDRILNRMISEGRIYTPKPGAYRVT